MYSSNRNDIRQVYFDAWRKAQANEMLTPLEAMIADVIAAHPEYHAIFNDPEKFQDKDYLPEMGESNPFLHIGLHISIREQVQVDRPSGVRAAYENLIAQKKDVMAVEHLMIEQLMDSLWRAQRDNTLPDEQAYLKNIQGLMK